MDLAVIHTIRDHAGWQQALADSQEYPPGFTLRSTVEATDGTRALCLWDAPSQAELQETLDSVLARVAINDVFPVEVGYFEGRDTST